MEKTIIADRLNILVKAQSRNQHDFSGKTGVDEAIISRILNGKCDPSAETIIKIAKATEVSADWLLGLKN